MGLCDGRWSSLCVSQTSNCMSCTVLHCLLLPHPHRTRLLQLLFRQSTPLPRARPLTRWRGHLQQVVLVPTQDLLLNLWPTLLNSTPRAHRGMPVHPSHRMALSQLPHLPRPKQQINQMNRQVPPPHQRVLLLPADRRGSRTPILPTAFAQTRSAPS